MKLNLKTLTIIVGQATNNGRRPTMADDQQWQTTNNGRGPTLTAI